MLGVATFLSALVVYCQAQSSGYNYVCRYVNSIDCALAAKIPVCATNGILYASECEFLKAHCQDVSLDVDINGPCVAPTTTPMMTNDTITTPMMTNDTLTTPMMTNETLTTPMMTNETLTTPMMTNDTLTTPMMSNITTDDMSSNSTDQVTTSAVNTSNVTTTPTPPDTTVVLSPLCLIVVGTNCPTDNSPVCASDFNEFSSICEFTKAQCYDPSLTVINSGHCPSSTASPTTTYDIICNFIATQNCTDDGVVICGSDKVTYGNSCEFEKAKCLDEFLQLQDVGPC